MKKAATFKNKDLKMAAEIHLPENFIETKNIPLLYVSTLPVVLKNKPSGCMLHGWQNMAL
jgi:hypothetical protein